MTGPIDPSRMSRRDRRAFAKENGVPMPPAGPQAGALEFSAVPTEMSVEQVAAPGGPVVLLLIKTPIRRDRIAAGTRTVLGRHRWERHLDLRETAHSDRHRAAAESKRDRRRERRRTVGA